MLTLKTVFLSINRFQIYIKTRVKIGICVEPFMGMCVAMLTRLCMRMCILMRMHA